MNETGPVSQLVGAAHTSVEFVEDWTPPPELQPAANRPGYLAICREHGELTGEGWAYVRRQDASATCTRHEKRHHA